MPTVEELSSHLLAMGKEKRPHLLRDFTLELVQQQIIPFLTEQFHRPFPRITLHLRDGPSYAEDLRRRGVPQFNIEGSSGFYLGNKYFADIIIDLEPVRLSALEGRLQNAVFLLANILIEEYTHSLFPKISDRDISELVMRLVESFFPGFKYTEEQKRAIADSVSGEPRDGLFEPDFGDSRS